MKQHIYLETPQTYEPSWAQGLYGNLCKVLKSREDFAGMQTKNDYVKTYLAQRLQGPHGERMKFADFEFRDSETRVRVSLKKVKPSYRSHIEVILKIGLE